MDFYPLWAKWRRILAETVRKLKFFPAKLTQHPEDTQIKQRKKKRFNLADALSGLVPKYSQVVRLATGYDNIWLTVSIEIGCFNVLNRRLLSA